MQILGLSFGRTEPLYLYMLEKVKQMPVLKGIAMEWVLGVAMPITIIVQ